MSDVYLTKDGYEKLQAELTELKKQKNDLSVEINDAREQGDLKENAGYIYGKQKQNILMNRISELELRLRSARIVDNLAINKAQVSLGATVTMKDENSGSVQTYTLSSADEADPSLGKISVSSPLAQGLLGAAEGASVKVRLPSGEKHLAILKVEYK
ncbi:MAG: transcription elongation factor GreA [Elusimicrobiales bacterium]|nr:transcription elongation factor GreA [Elusimicrobiales bacterium]